MVGVRIAFGEIHSINESTYTATVKIEEDDGSITGDLQILTQLSYGNMEAQLPEVKTPCIVLMFDDDSQRGVVIGARYSTKNPCELSKGKKIISYKKSKIIINENGIIEIENEEINIKSKIIKIESKEIEIKGKITLDGETIVKNIIKAKDFVKI